VKFNDYQREAVLMAKCIVSKKNAFKNVDGYANVNVCLY